MNNLELVDQLYEVFVDTLSGPFADAARGLAVTLCLAPSRTIPWSRVFGHEVTLAAPALVAEAMPHVAEPVRRDAIFAHMLAVIEAFGTDRVEDGQVQATPELVGLLEQVREARDRALTRVCPGAIDPAIDFGLADRKTAYAIRAEHDLLQRGTAITFETYERLSLGKQSVGFPASIALAYAAGWESARRSLVYRTLASVWLGLQMHDDVVDWEDDFTRGGAWAVSLALGRRAAADEREFMDTPVVRRQVYAEHQSAGYAVRAHALAPWAGEVLV
jgi:hypothetical protein